ncbi:MAG: ornithine carbamoyltransferase, partial [Pseudomonadota bacterium]
MRHFLDLDRVPAEELRAILTQSRAMKDARAGLPKGMADAETPLAGRLVALIFEKPSTRTRVSFDVGIRQMGGET